MSESHHDPAAQDTETEATPPVDPRLAPSHPALHAHNRARLLDALSEGEGVLVFASPHHLRNADTEYRYRQHSDVIWLTGWRDPECAVLIRKGADAPFVMFVQPRNIEREIWTGRRPGPEGARELFGADEAHEWGELAQVLPGLLQGLHTLHYGFADQPEHDRTVITAIRKARRNARRSGLDVPDCFIDPQRLLHELRMHKSEAELDILRQAAAITHQAHTAAMRATAPGVHEYELEAIIDGTFRRQGGSGPGYTTIVGGGDNATILHYVRNNAPLKAGTLVCVDAGCELHGYTADVTRTWPVDGVFTDAQKELYEAVLQAEVAAIEDTRPGVTHHELHTATIRRLTVSMVALGFFDGDPEDTDLIDSLIEDESYKRYYMHGTGHWLGLDVHDVGAYSGKGSSRPLAAGMVMTIEPGLYVPPDDAEAPERFRGIGIRIEDDVLVTEDGCEVLTASIPKSVEDVEAACRREP